MKFTIKEGHHYSTPFHIRLHFGITKIKFKIKFSDNCIYPMDDVNVDADDYDINKGYGFSHFYHHWNSVRLGWIPSVSQVGRIELYKYIYNHGSRIQDYNPIATVDTERWYEVTIEVNELFQTATFKVRDAELGFTLCTSSSTYEVPKIKWGYKLDFHFGGDHVAPNDMSACIEEIPF